MFTKMQCKLSPIASLKETAYGMSCRNPQQEFLPFRILALSVFTVVSIKLSGNPICAFKYLPQNGAGVAIFAMVNFGAIRN